MLGRARSLGKPSVDHVSATMLYRNVSKCDHEMRVSEMSLVQRVAVADTAAQGKTGPVIPGGYHMAGISGNKKSREQNYGIGSFVLLSFLIYSANFGSLYQRT